MSLNASQLDSLPVGRHADGDGLYLQVTDSGSRLWRFRYRHNGRESMVSLGNLETTSLSEARTKARAARVQVDNGESPSEARQAAREAGKDTFENVARVYMDRIGRKLAAGTAARDQNLIDRWLNPVIGSRPLREIEPSHIATALTRMSTAGRASSAGRAKALAGRIFRHAFLQGRCARNPAADFRVSDVVKVPEVTHRAALLHPKDVGQLLRDIDAYAGQPATRLALKLLPHVVLRSNELRGATWGEIDFERGEWRIPRERMKMKEGHTVPLSRQVVNLLLESLPVDDSKPRGLIFPSYVPGRSISDGTLNRALMRMGYATDEHQPHGFRATFASLQADRGVDRELVELQLAHKERNQVRAAYMRSERLEDRRAMMQEWSDYLDSLK